MLELLVGARYSSVYSEWRCILGNKIKYHEMNGKLSLCDSDIRQFSATIGWCQSESRGTLQINKASQYTYTQAILIPVY